MKKVYKIAHMSDLHCGSQYFIPHMLEKVIHEINEEKPDVVIITGDLTEQGFKEEYRAAHGFITQLECPDVLVVPGNHDSRNVGYLHFEDFFGPRDFFRQIGPFDIICMDSSEPDLDEGRIGREKYSMLTRHFSDPSRLRIVAFHHHLVPIPGTGRERNILIDAGDFLRVLVEHCVNLVLAGHRHVPNIWRFEDFFVINSGTACTRRVRGYTEPCYNIIEYDGELMNVYRRIPFKKKMLELSTNRFEGICEVPLTKGGERD